MMRTTREMLELDDEAGVFKGIKRAFEEEVKKDSHVQHEINKIHIWTQMLALILSIMCGLVAMLLMQAVCQLSDRDSNGFMAQFFYPQLIMLIASTAFGLTTCLFAISMTIELKDGNYRHYNPFAAAFHILATCGYVIASTYLIMYLNTSPELPETLSETIKSIEEAEMSMSYAAAYLGLIASFGHAFHPIFTLLNHYSEPIPLRDLHSD